MCVCGGIVFRFFVELYVFLRFRVWIVLIVLDCNLWKILWLDVWKFCIEWSMICRMIGLLGFGMLVKLVLKKFCV